MIINLIILHHIFIFDFLHVSTHSCIYCARLEDEINLEKIEIKDIMTLGLWQFCRQLSKNIVT